ncbi:MAG: T9SS type A sorting domain-containing protein [Bacteroidia bacterium]|nr:T9SS type A sorting domain-containing protein [Bacteroidia bacterium]NNJ56564.1 T9SS type A sorting domain-containing protein [Bacteroidia bacterium]
MKRFLQIAFLTLFISTAAFATGDVKLGQNYPNPANEKTYVEVQFSSPQATLTISNILGKTLEVKTLPNSGTFVVDVTNLPTGIYFYTLEADGEKVTKKMTVKN